MSNANSIRNKQECMEAYDELMIKIAMSSYAEIDGKELSEENERLKKLPEFQLTPKVKEKLRRAIDREYFRSSVYRFGKGAYAAANKVAMIFLIMSVVFATTMYVSADFRSSIYKLILTYEKQYTLIELDSSTELEFVGSEVYTWSHAYAPTVMPRGYEVTDVIVVPNAALVTYSNDDNGYITFYQTIGEGSGTSQVDTENAQSVQTILINDSESLAVSKNGLNIIVWGIGDTFFTLESNGEMETLISVAKGIKLLR